MWRPSSGRPALRHLWDEQPGLFRGYVADVALSAGFGLLTLSGGRDKTTASAWHVVNVNGGPALWGSVFFVVAACLALAGLTSPVTLARTLQTASLLYAVMCVAFGSAFLHGESNGTGAVLLLYVAVNYALRALAYLEGPRTTPGLRPWTA